MLESESVYFVLFGAILAPSGPVVLHMFACLQTPRDPLGTAVLPIVARLIIWMCLILLFENSVAPVGHFISPMFACVRMRLCLFCVRRRLGTCWARVAYLFVACVSLTWKVFDCCCSYPTLQELKNGCGTAMLFVICVPNKHHRSSKVVAEQPCDC